MSGFNLSVQWRTALAQENGASYRFPGKFTSYFREKYSVPAVYRWRAMRKAGGEKEPIYIGEAEELPRRIQRVLTPSKTAKGSDTNKRLNRIFHEFVAAGRDVVLDIADIEPFEIDGIRFGRETLGDRFKRRAMENVLLAIAQSAPGYELLNIIVDPVEKVRQRLATLPPRTIRELAKRYGLDKSQRQ